MRIFLDVGILFSASRPESLMARFTAKLSQFATLCSNSYAVEEARRNLQLKFPERETELNSMLLGISLVESTVSLPEVEIRSKDRPILEGAVAAQATHLLTSDRCDFGPFFGKTIQGVLVVSPQLLADELVDRGLLDRR
jgi:hypothetical protein